MFSLTPTPTNLTFSAPSRTAVRSFYAAALDAGGTPHGSPAYRDTCCGWFNAAVLDLDGNSIEVLHCDEAPAVAPSQTDNSAKSVLLWQESVADISNDVDTVVSASSAKSSRSKTSPQSKNKASSVAPNVTRLTTRSVSAPILPPSAQISSNTPPSKTLVGTLLGAAAGAAIAYAMCASQDNDSGNAEKVAYDAWKAAKPRLLERHASCETPPPPPPPPGSNTSYDNAHRFLRRAIEYWPQANKHISALTLSPAAVAGPPPQRVIEWRPSKTEISVEELPDDYTVPQSVVSSRHFRRPRRPEVVESVASSCHSKKLPEGYPLPESTASSRHSHRSSDSKSGSLHSHKHKNHRSKSKYKAPSVHTLLSEGKADLARHDPGVVTHDEKAETETLAPSDSISNAGSRRRSLRSGRSKGSSSTSSKHSHSSSRRARHYSNKRSGQEDEEDEGSKSDSTVKPARKGSAVSLPLRTGEKKDKKRAGKRSTVSLAFGL
ncbi:hypothetical protein LTS18_003752 [Coniosporium uncinatum]|uniref:Uncharacterized protein n=1 Tax=Coniosporium uncinatum TaxID=93489 RepID=A0ACC3D6T6_9PEZI|nr:hypothetical protein LTS18_003752 [Coniosporium uncinatum]